MPDDYLYNYTIFLIQSDGNEKKLASYKSNSAPPFIGAILELDNFLPTSEDGSEFKVTTITIVPYRDPNDTNEDNPASNITYVDVWVKPHA